MPTKGICAVYTLTLDAVHACMRIQAAETVVPCPSVRVCQLRKVSGCKLWRVADMGKTSSNAISRSAGQTSCAVKQTSRLQWREQRELLHRFAASRHCVVQQTMSI